MQLFTECKPPTSRQVWLERTAGIQAQGCLVVLEAEALTSDLPQTRVLRKLPSLKAGGWYVPPHPPLCLCNLL